MYISNDPLVIFWIHTFSPTFYDNSPGHPSSRKKKKTERGCVAFLSDNEFSDLVINVGCYYFILTPGMRKVKLRKCHAVRMFCSQISSSCQSDAKNNTVSTLSCCHIFRSVSECTTFIYSKNVDCYSVWCSVREVDKKKNQKIPL